MDDNRGLFLSTGFAGGGKDGGKEEKAVCQEGEGERGKQEGGGENEDRGKHSLAIEGAYGSIELEREVRMVEGQLTNTSISTFLVLPILKYILLLFFSLLSPVHWFFSLLLH